jgi:hypothetical protein
VASTAAPCIAIATRAAWGGWGIYRGFLCCYGVVALIGHTAQFVCSAEGLISSLSLIADGENQELGPI